MNIGDIVVVIDNKSIPDLFLGKYGRVIDSNDYKVTVEFIQKTKWKGSLSHTANRSDLKKVGEVNF
jgi:hypothetical protein